MSNTTTISRCSKCRGRFRAFSDGSGWHTTTGTVSCIPVRAADGGFAEPEAPLEVRSFSEWVHQPREHPVPCQGCRSMTWNRSAICDTCELASCLHGPPAR